MNKNDIYRILNDLRYTKRTVYSAYDPINRAFLHALIDLEIVHLGRVGYNDSIKKYVYLLPDKMEDLLLYSSMELL